MLKHEHAEACPLRQCIELFTMEAFQNQQALNDRLLRLPDLIGRRASNGEPAIDPVIPVSASALWAMIKAGRFPRGIKLSSRVTCWRASDVNAWLAEQRAA